MPNEHSELRLRDDQRTSVPRRYKVVLHNDDFTTMEFVVYVLVIVFRKDVDSAVMLMQSVHTGGRAVAGVYSYDIAISKIKKATDMARAEGFPLRLTAEPE